MTMQHRQSAAAPLWERVVADPRLLLRLISFDRGRRSSGGVSIPTVPIYLRFFAEHQRLVLRGASGVVVLIALVSLGGGGLWWRLASGPVQLVVVARLLAAAIEETFGS